MKIKRVIIEGFGSIIEPLKYKFDRPGLNMIVGPNGIGKTTILNATYWCLYGKLLKGKESSPNPWPNVLDSTFCGTKVTVELDGVQIIRCNEYTEKVHGIKGKNGIFIVEEGKLRPERDKRDNQVYINKLIGYSSELFRNSVLFGQKLKRLLEEDGPKKKEIFDEAFESTFILRARESVEERIKDLKFRYNQVEHNYNLETAIIEENKAHLENAEKEIKKWQRAHKDNLIAIREEIRGIKMDILSFEPGIKSNLEANLKNRDKLLINLDKDLVSRELKKDFEIKGLESDGEGKQKEINKLKRKTPYCESCGQRLRGEAKIKHRQSIKSKLTVLQKEYEKIINKISDARMEHKQLLGKIKNEEKTRGEFADLEKAIAYQKREVQKYKNNKANLKVLKNDLKKLKTQKCPINKEAFISKINDRVVIRESIERERNKVKKKLEIDEWLIRDPLSNSGLKAFIFDSMLNKVNHFLKTYTKHIGFGVRVYVDLNSANKDFKISILKGTQEVPYDDLSGGQKQLADVAICFALNDTVTMNKPINILVMDEVFESLSEENIEIVGNIITQKSHNKSIHIITHNRLFNPQNCYKIFLKYTEPGRTTLDQKYKAA